MAALDPAAVLALALSCSPIKVDPHLVLAIARTESGLDPAATHTNSNGTTDIGLMQVNSANFSWLGLTRETALDPCASIKAGVRVLTSLSTYNTGRPTAGIDNGYDAKVLRAYRDVRSGTAASTAIREVAPTPCDAPRSDVWGQLACREAAAATSPTQESTK